jgi:hypothetical protein
VPYSHPRNGRKQKFINVDICIFNIMEDIFHNFLSLLREAFKTVLSIKPSWRTKNYERCFLCKWRGHALKENLFGNYET